MSAVAAPTWANFRAHASRRAGRGWAVRAGWWAVVLLVVVNGPLFVRMPLWPDAIFYDLYARSVMEGGVAYRDVFDSNLPGIMLLHMLIRTAWGWSSEALRLADLVFLTGILVLLAKGLSSAQCQPATKVWAAFFIGAFYFSTSEYCHCQRDIWMLLPALAALLLRCRQVFRVQDPCESELRLGLAAVLEGVCWGAALWIKPHVAVPAIACWLVSAWQVIRYGTRTQRRLAVDLAGLIGGGLLIAAPGLVWLWWTGAWPYFLEIFRDWNHEYLSQASFAGRGKACFATFFPWSLVHMVAVPLALFRVLCGRGGPADDSVPSSPWLLLLATLYVGWLFQVLVFQQGFAYHFVPPLLLGLTLVASYHWPWRRTCGLIAAALLLWTILDHPMLRYERLALWPRCLQGHATAELQDRLALTGAEHTRYLFDRGDLGQVAEYLRDQWIKPGELTVFDWRAIHLYLELDVPPSTRFIMLDTFLNYYPSKRETIWRELDESQQVYLVTDLTCAGLDRAKAAAVGPDGPLTLPPAFPRSLQDLYPWSEPIVFRAGQYAVHRVTGRPKVLERGQQLAIRSPWPAPAAPANRLSCLIERLRK